MIKVRDYFDFCITNPFKLYNKIKTYFRPLKPKVYFDNMKGHSAKILEICSFDVTWKDKWNSPRHEFNPRIMISLFNRFHWRIEFTLGEDYLTDMVYWEAALSWLYYGLSLPDAIKKNTGWTQFNKETNEEEPIKFVLLREPWQTRYKYQTLKDIFYENTTR